MSNKTLCAVFFLPLIAILVGCGASGEPGSGHATISSITGPLAALKGTEFTITGSQFSNLIGRDVTIEFRASSGRPFHDGTSATVVVPGTIRSETRITGMSPRARLSGRGTAHVRVRFDSGLMAESRDPIAVFEAPLIWDLGRWNQAAWGP